MIIGTVVSSGSHHRGIRTTFLVVELEAILGLRAFMSSNRHSLYLAKNYVTSTFCSK
jgi:hypothetical protein